MKNIEFQLLTYVITILFMVIGLSTYFITGKIYAPAWMASFVALVVTYGLDIVDRIEIEGEENEKITES